MSGKPKNMGAWNTVRNYIDRTLEMINFGDKSVKYVGRNAASSTATGNLNKHLAQQKEILERYLRLNGRKNNSSNFRWSVTEATVSKWLKSQGEKVTADEPIVELETDKVNVEVPAPINGVLSSITVKEGETVNVGSLLGTINGGTAKAQANSRKKNMIHETRYTITKQVFKKNNKRRKKRQNL